MIADFWLAPLVIAKRIPVVADELVKTAAGNPPVKGRSETERMVTEKIAALAEGIFHANVEALKLQFEFGITAATGNLPGTMRLAREAPIRIAKAALGPGRKKVRANAKRLVSR